MSDYDSEDEWLRSIGATVTGDTDDDLDYEDGSEELDPHDEDAAEDLENGDEDDDEVGGYPGESIDDDGDLDLGFDEGPVLLDEVPDEYLAADRDDSDSVDNSKTRRRFTPWVLGALGTAVIAATVITASVAVINSPDAPPPASPRTTAPPRPPASAAAAPPPQNIDGPLPFNASADCDQGSTSAQSVADPNSPVPFICVRRVDGQVVTLELGQPAQPRAYVITALVIIPGATKPIPGSTKDPWLQHRVVSRIQWQFNDTDNTIVHQETGNVHGEAIVPVPRVLASKITMIIQQTSRPPVVAPANQGPNPGGGSVFGDILGPPAQGSPAPVIVPGGPQQSDPSDGTFAISSIKVIGHKAI